MYRGTPLRVSIPYVKPQWEAAIGAALLCGFVQG